MRFAGPVALAAAFGVAALFLAVASGGPCEDGTAADFRTVVCDPRSGALDALHVGLFVASPLLALTGGLVGVRLGGRWPLVTGVVGATLALAAALYVGTLDQPASEVESISVAPTTCSPTCPRGLTVRVALDAPSSVLLGVRPVAGGAPVRVRVRGPGGRRAAQVSDGQSLRLDAESAALRVAPAEPFAPGAYLVLVQPASGETAQAQFTVSR